MLQFTWSDRNPIVVLALVQDVSSISHRWFDPCLCRACFIFWKAGHFLFRLLRTMVLETRTCWNHIHRRFGDVVIFGVVLCLFIIILWFELDVLIFWDYHDGLRSTFSLFDFDLRPWQLEFLIFSGFINCPSFQQFCLRTFATLSQITGRFEMSTPFFLGFE